MKLLVTAGATREPLDEVRFLSNISTGATGAALAEAFSARGHDVTLLRGESAKTPSAGVRDVETFSSAADLLARLAARLRSGAYDGVVMTAAVADYRPDNSRAGKITSDADELVVRFVRNPKLLPQLKSLSPCPLTVVGFKFTVGADGAAARVAVEKQWAAGGVDATVQNDLHEIRAATVHPFRLWTALTREPQPVAGVPALGEALLPLFARR